MELIAVKYKMTEVGLIPSDWEVKSLSEITRTFVGRDLKTNHFSSFQDHEYKYPVYSNTVDAEGLYGYYNIAEYQGESLTIVGRGVGLGTTFRRTGGYGAIGRLLVLFPNENTDTKFLTEYINHRVTIHSESNAIPQLTGVSIGNYKIALPPTIAEQTAIATALSDADNYISSLEKLIAKKRLLKHGAMQQLLSPKEDWVVKKVSDLCEVGRGRVISHREIGTSINSSFPVYSSQTTNNGIMGYIDTYGFDGEYITWTTDGEKAGTVFYRNGKFNCTNVCGTLKVRKGNAKYFAIALNQIASRHVSRNLANPKLMNDVMKKIEIQMPSPEEQTHIATILSDMDAGIAALEKQLAKARSIKQGMMQQLLTGKIRLV